jgi:murein DD-endopeptidase MepM/ murein hydrolase activator NlpD
MQKKRRRIQVQLYSKGTGKPKIYSIPVVVVAGWLLGLAIIVLAFVFWLPDNMINRKNLRVFEIAKEQRTMQLTANKMEKQILEANTKIESGNNLRNRANQLAGLANNGKLEKKKNQHGKEQVQSVDFERIKKSLATYKGLRDKMLEREQYTGNLPLLRPIKQNKNITNKFGLIQDPFTKMELPHRGLDFAVREGDTVIATGDGIVDKITRHRAGFGLTLEVQHSPQIKTVYAHLQNTLVQPGKPVKRGQPIALAGKSGSVLWPVLHYEIHYYGQPIDPEDYFITP